jgi:heat shock protein HslJ
MPLPLRPTAGSIAIALLAVGCAGPGGTPAPAARATAADAPAPAPTPTATAAEAPAPRPKDAAVNPSLGLKGVTWVCTSIEGYGMPTGEAPTIEFADNGNFSGYAGVNRYFGLSKIKGQRVSLGDIGATKMAGPPERMALERAFTECFPRIRSYRIDDGRLELSDDNAILLTFVSR